MNPTELWKSGIRKTPESRCLECGHKVNAGAAADGSGSLPGPNDVVVCLKCGAVMRYADEMTLRGMTDAEMDELTSDKEWMDEVARTVKKVHMVRASVG